MTFWHEEYGISKDAHAHLQNAERHAGHLANDLSSPNEGPWQRLIMIESRTACFDEGCFAVVHRIEKRLTKSPARWIMAWMFTPLIYRLWDSVEVPVIQTDNLKGDLFSPRLHHSF